MKYGLSSLTLTTREILGWRLSDNGSSKTAEAALEEALVHRFGALGRIHQPLALRSDNGLPAELAASRTKKPLPMSA